MKQRERLARILEQKGMSAYALAKAVGYKPQTVYNWVYGHGTPTPAVMLKMTKILGVSAQEILEIFAESKICDRMQKRKEKSLSAIGER